MGPPLHVVLEAVGPGRVGESWPARSRQKAAEAATVHCGSQRAHYSAHLPTYVPDVGESQLPRPPCCQTDLRYAAKTSPTPGCVPTSPTGPDSQEPPAWATQQE